MGREALHIVTVCDLDHLQIVVALEEKLRHLVGDPGADHDLAIHALGMTEEPEQLAQAWQWHLETDVHREVFAVDVADADDAHLGLEAFSLRSVPNVHEAVRVVAPAVGLHLHLLQELDEQEDDDVSETELECGPPAGEHADGDQAHHEQETEVLSEEFLHGISRWEVVPT